MPSVTSAVSASASRIAIEGPVGMYFWVIMRLALYIGYLIPRDFESLIQPSLRLNRRWGLKWDTIWNRNKGFGNPFNTVQLIFFCYTGVERSESICSVFGNSRIRLEKREIFLRLFLTLSSLGVMGRRISKH